MKSAQTERDLDAALRWVETSKFEYCLGNPTPAKLSALKAIKLLHPLLKNALGELTPQEAARLNDLFRETFAFYEAIDSSTVFTLSEQLIWLGSKINGNHFPPYSPASFFVSTDGYEETPLSLSKAQTARLERWQSLQGAHPVQDWGFAQDLEDISQDALTDCSVVASLLSIVNNNPALMRDLITPHQPSPKYCVTLFVNGCRRQAIIDDRVPFLTGTAFLYTRSLSNPAMVWPALVEKAYLKLCGYGYDFVGSNIAIDTYSLIGWLPELVPIESSRFPRWDELFAAFEAKQLLLGVGTGKISPALSRNANLVSEHDYAVTGLRVHKGERQVLFKNPWNTQGPRERWLPESAMHSFKVLYLSWDPRVYPFQKTLNYMFTHKALSCTENYIGLPQHTLTNPHKIPVEIAIVLETNLEAKLQALPEAKLLVFETNGQRLLQRGKLLYKGFHLENSRIKHAFFTLGAGQRCTVVTSSAESQRFSMGVYAKQPLGVTKSVAMLPHQTLQHGLWDAGSAGGNWSYSTYVQNPQYELVVSERDTTFNLALWTDSTRHVNLHVFYQEGSPLLETLTTFDQTKALVNGKYNPTSQVHENVHLPPGRYIVVLSTYDPAPLAPFGFCVESNHPIQTRRLSPMLGLFTRKTIVETTPFTFGVKRVADIVLRATFATAGEDASRLRLSVCEVSMTEFIQSYPGTLRSGWGDARYGVFLETRALKPGRYTVVVERERGPPTPVLLQIGSSLEFHAQGSE